MNNGYKVFGIILLAAFSAVSAMDHMTGQEKKQLRLLVKDVTSLLIDDYPNADIAAIKGLEEICVNNGFQAYAYQIKKARRQGKKAVERDLQNMLLGQPPASRRLGF